MDVCPRLAESGCNHALVSTNYTRHVFLIAAIDAYDHVRALVHSMNNKPLIDDDHAKHTITREFTDRDLEIEEKKRTASRAAAKGKK